MYMSFSIETTMHRYNESCGKEAKDDRYQRTSRDGHPSSFSKSLFVFRNFQRRSSGLQTSDVFSFLLIRVSE